MAISERANAAPAALDACAISVSEIPNGSPGFPFLTFLQSILGAGAILLAFVGFWRNRATYLLFVDNSDLLFYAQLYSDLAGGQYSMRGWRPPAVPFFFPDMPAFFAALFLTPNLPAGYCLFAGSMIAGLIGCLYCIGRFVEPTRGPRIMLAGLAALAVLPLACSKNTGYWGTFRWLIAPNAHGGGALAGLALIALGLWVLDRPSLKRYIAFLVFASLGVTSDVLVLLHDLIPLLVGGFFQAAMRRTRMRPVLVLTGIVIFVWATADLLVWFVARCVGVGTNRIKPHTAEGERLAQTWHRFWHDMASIAGPRTALFILAAAGIFAAACAIVLARRTLAGARLQTLGMIAFASCAAALALPVPFGVWANADCSRYLLPILTMPLLMLFASALVLAGRANSWVWTFAVAGAMGGVIVMARPALACVPVDHAAIFYTDEVRFVDRISQKYHLHAGYGNYWQCRRMTMFSRAGVVVNEADAVDGDLRPSSWMNNPQRWTQRPRREGGGYPIYDFCVFDSADEVKALIAACGPPAIEEPGPGFKLLIYNRPQDVVFRNLCRCLATQDAHVKPSRLPTPRSLAHPRMSGADWNVNGSLPIPPGGQAVVTLTGDGGADFLDISTYQPNTYELTFQQGTQTVGSLRIEPGASKGFRSRGISLVPILGGKPFDTIKIRAAGGGDHPTVGHVFVFDDPVIHP